jgi:Uma2 family endonuclease
MQIMSQPRHWIDATSAGITMTPEEFDAIEDADELYRYELVRGVLVVCEFHAAAETDAGEELGHLLWRYKENHANGAVIDAMLPRWYVRTATSRRFADRVVWVGLRRKPEPMADAPAIAVEFVVSGRRYWPREYQEKWNDYRRAGVLEYWVIDGFERNMLVFRSGDPQVVAIAERDTYRPPMLPGFELPLARVLATADRWDNRQ